MGLAAFNRMRRAQEDALAGSTKIADVIPQDEPQEKPRRKKAEEPQAPAPEAPAEK